MRNSLKHVVLLNSGISYLLRDDFTDTLTAGNVDGTAATPGPGLRNVTDPSNNIDISGGTLRFNGNSGITAEYVNYDIGPRAAGRIIMFSYDDLPNSTHVSRLDAFANISFSQAYIYSVASGSAVSRTDTGEATVLPAGTLSGTHKIAFLIRDTGCLGLIDYGTGWKFVMATKSPTSINLWLSFYGVATDVRISSVRVPKDLYLPTPLASDGAFGATTDGQGHAETSGIGSGGNGLAWTDNKGTWSGGSATVLSGGEAIRTVDAGNADVFVDLDITRTAGNASIMLRYTDDDNYLRCGTDGTNAVLVEKVSGTENTLSTTAITYGAADTMRIRLEGQAARIYYDDAFVSATSSIDASLTGTKVGLYTTDTGNSFDNLVAYASTGYTFLNQFVS